MPEAINCDVKYAECYCGDIYIVAKLVLCRQDYIKNKILELLQFNNDMNLKYLVSFVILIISEYFK